MGKTEKQLVIPVGENRWVELAVKTASPPVATIPEKVLAKTLVETAYSFSREIKAVPAQRRLLLSAAFDLLVSAEYYRAVAHAGWIYCPTSARLYYPYTNVCPECILKGSFMFHRANKPRSGAIGSSTSRLLLVFLDAVLKHLGRKARILKGREPIDSITVDETTSPPTALFSEIKASPLITLPLIANTQRLTVEQQGKAVPISAHEIHDHSAFYGAETLLAVPKLVKKTWTFRDYSLGKKQNATDNEWAYRGLTQLIAKEKTFLSDYFEFWSTAIATYGPRNQEAIYWLTNGSGQPNPRPEGWPTVSGSNAFESVSDSKTSVGMDRTDDIKKGIYQVLKLGAEGKPQVRYSYKVGLITNIHPIRHFDEYLEALKDIIWTRDPEAKARRAKDLPPQTELFNLFDGIIALSQTLARDAWVTSTFDF